MITVNSNLSGKYFSSVIPNVVFSIDGYRALVSMTVDGASIFAEYLYPVNGKISISDLTNLLSPYAKASLSIVLSINIKEEYSNSTTTNVASISCSVVYCSADIQQDCATFCENHFLSIMLGTKVTAAGRLEYLHYLGTDKPSCVAYYTDGTFASFTPPTVGGNSTYSTVDASSSHFVTEGKELSYYVLSAGARRQEYEIDPEAPDCAPILIFVNSFGVEELAYCTGTHKVSPKFTRSTTYMDGIQKNYRIEEARTFSADTGVMNTAMANWFDDVFRSEYVRVVNFYNGIPNIGKELIITDSKSDNSNEDDELPRFTFTYQYAQRNQNVLQLNREGRIFDNTFDFTFN